MRNTVKYMIWRNTIIYSKCIVCWFILLLFSSPVSYDNGWVRCRAGLGQKIGPGIFGLDQPRIISEAQQTSNLCMCSLKECILPLSQTQL